MLQLLAVILMGAADLYRGSEAGTVRVLEKVIYGALALLALLGVAGAVAALSDWRFALGYFAAFSIGSSLSWGTMIGHMLDRRPLADYPAAVEADKAKGRGLWFLRGYFARTPLRGLVIRGFLWGLPPAIPLLGVVGVQPAVAMLAAYTLAMPLAVLLVLSIEGSAADRPAAFISRKLAGRTNSWSRQEIYRGWIAGLILLGSSLV